MGSIYLIRHGQASFGADDYDVLSPTGIRQAEILGDHLLNLGVRFDRVQRRCAARQARSPAPPNYRVLRAGHAGVEVRSGVHQFLKTKGARYAYFIG